jgi:hypothetical protein
MFWSSWVVRSGVDGRESYSHRLTKALKSGDTGYQYHAVRDGEDENAVLVAPCSKRSGMSLWDLISP